MVYIPSEIKTDRLIEGCITLQKCREDIYKAIKMMLGDSQTFYDTTSPRVDELEQEVKRIIGDRLILSSKTKTT